MRKTILQFCCHFLLILNSSVHWHWVFRVWTCCKRVRLKQKICYL